MKTQVLGGIAASPLVMNGPSQAVTATITPIKGVKVDIISAEKGPKHGSFILTGCFFVGLRRPPACWGGDKESAMYYTDVLSHLSDQGASFIALAGCPLDPARDMWTCNW